MDVDVDVDGESWVGGVWCKASEQQWRRYGSVTDNKARDVAQQSGAASPPCQYAIAGNGKRQTTHEQASKKH